MRAMVYIIRVTAHRGRRQDQKREAKEGGATVPEDCVPKRGPTHPHREKVK